MTESYCYLLYCGSRTYIGATYDPHRRLEQHNGIRSGGARATHGKQWELALYVSGFPDWNTTLSFEWAWKRESRKTPGVYGKVGGLDRLLHKRTATSKTVPYKYWPNAISMSIIPKFYQISEKIEQVKQLTSKCVPTNLTHTFLFQPFFLSNKMSVSSFDITTLAQKVEELSLDVTTLKTQLAALLERNNPATAEKTPRKPRAKKAVAAPIADMTTVAPTNEIVEKKPRKPRAKKAVAEPTTAVAEPTTDGATTDAGNESATEKKPRKPRAKKVAAEPTPAAAEPTPAAAAEAKPDAGNESSTSEKKPRKPRAKKAEQTVAAPTE